jgi:hypothetical protein
MKNMRIGYGKKLLPVVITCNNNTTAHAQKVMLVSIWQYENAETLGGDYFESGGGQ